MASGASRRAAENRKKKAVVAEEPGPELVDATRYDFERLEVVVRGLVERHHELMKDNTSMAGQIAASDARAGALEEEVLDLRKRRERTQERLEGLIGHLDRLEAELDRSPKAKRAR